MSSFIYLLPTVPSIKWNLFLIDNPLNIMSSPQGHPNSHIFFLSNWATLLKLYMLKSTYANAK